MAQVDELAEMDLTKGGPEKHDSRFDRIPLRDTEAPVSPRSSSHSPRSPPRSPALASQSRTPNKSPKSASSKSGTPRQASASSRNNSQGRSASASPVPTAISMTQEVRLVTVSVSQSDRWCGRKWRSSRSSSNGRQSENPPPARPGGHNDRGRSRAHHPRRASRTRRWSL